MLSTIRFWNSNHSEKALYHDRNFTYYYNDILNKKEAFINSSSENDIRVIPKFNNNQVEMSFIVSHSQLLKLQQNNNFDITKNVLFCFLPLIEFKDFKFDTNSKYKLEFWRVIDWEHIYFPPKDKSKILEQNGSLTIYARKDVIYTNKDELNPTELFINRSTDFVPSTENLQLCSPVCAYGADVKKQLGNKTIIKSYDKEVKDFEDIYVLETSDGTKAREYFTNFTVFWKNWVNDILGYVPDKTYGNYWTLKSFYPSFRTHEKFGNNSYYGSNPYYYPVYTTDYDYFPYSRLNSSFGHIYYVPYDKSHFRIDSGTSTSWKFHAIPLLPWDYRIYNVSGQFNTTKIKRDKKIIDTDKFYFTYFKGDDYSKIVSAFSSGLNYYVNFDTFYRNQFVKTATAIATAMGIPFKILKIQKTNSKSLSTRINIDIGIIFTVGSPSPTPAPLVIKHTDKAPDEIVKDDIGAQFLDIRVYSQLIYESENKKEFNSIFQNELPFSDHWDAAHIHKSMVGNRIGVFPIDRRYDYKESITGTGSNTVVIYNTDSSEIRDIGNVNVTQMTSEAVDSILLNVQKERERFNRLQALNNRQSLIRNSINTFSNLLELPTIFKPNPDYWNPAPIRVDIPEDWGYERTGWISEGMKRNAKRFATYTPYLKSAARTEWLEAASQGAPFMFGGSFAAMGIRSVFRGAFSTIQGWINSSMERERAQLQMNLKEEQALNIAVNISNDLEQQFPWLSKDDVYMLTYTTGNKELIAKDRRRYGNFINEFKYFYQLGGISNGYYSVNVENTDWAQLYNMTTTEAEIFKVLMRQGIFWNPTNLNKFSDNSFTQYVERFEDE